jgi:CubicO group peptidase (beta-lactamase class C family)
MRHRTETWLALLALTVALVITAILGMWGYMSITAERLHPNPEESPSVTGPAPPRQWDTAVKQAAQIVRAALDEQNLPGLSVAVGMAGDIVWAEGFGWADLDRRVRVSPSSRFRTGTASVALTSAAVGLLLEEQRLTLDDEIQKYAPGFPRKEFPVTLRQMMGHLSGVRSDGGDEGPLFSERCERPADALPFFADRPLLSEPGTRFDYSSYGWIVVSAAVEAAAGEPFLSFMRTRVFEPLGMTDTVADSTAPMPNRVTFYFPRFAADPHYGLHPMRPLDYSCYAGASVFLSTPSDLVQFGMAIHSGTLLQGATAQLLQTSQRLSSGQETGYGLGWDLETVTLAGQPALAVGHDGEVLGGMAATLMTLPAHGIVAAVMSNISYANTNVVALRVAEAFTKRLQMAGEITGDALARDLDIRRTEQDDSDAVSPP